MHDTTSSKTVRGVLFALGATVIWSGNFILARGLNQSIEPATLALLRWATAFAGLLPFACWAAWKERAAIRRSLPAMIPMAVLGVSVFNTLLYKAAQTSSALNLSLIATSTPVFIILLARIFLAERLTMGKILGLGTALGGVLLLITGGDPTRLFSLEVTIGDLWMSLAAVTFAAYSILVRRFRQPLSQPVFLLTLFGVGIVFLLPWAGWEISMTGLAPDHPRRSGSHPVHRSGRIPGRLCHVEHGRGRHRPIPGRAHLLQSAPLQRHGGLPLPE